eukprot:s256_g1.t1
MICPLKTFQSPLRNKLHDEPTVQGRYSFVREFSFSVPPIWREKKWGQPPLLVFHDANPSYGAVRTDLAAWWPLLAEGGTMAGSNYTTEGDGSVVGVRQAVDEFAASDCLCQALIVLLSYRRKSEAATMEAVAFLNAGYKYGMYWWDVLMVGRSAASFLLMAVPGRILRIMSQMTLIAVVSLLENSVKPWSRSNNGVLRRASNMLSAGLILTAAIAAW